MLSSLLGNSHAINSFMQNKFDYKMFLCIFYTQYNDYNSSKSYIQLYDGSNMIKKMCGKNNENIEFKFNAGNMLKKNLIMRRDYGLIVYGECKGSDKFYF